jgi:hypothetical protein
MKKKTTNKWKHIGGGCMLMGNSKFPADDSYENIKTVEVITLVSTREAHLKMPARAKSIAELLKIKGVKKA